MKEKKHSEMVFGHWIEYFGKILHGTRLKNRNEYLNILPKIEKNRMESI